MARSTQEYVYFMLSETLPSACYILFNESSIPCYSNGYKKKATNSEVRVRVGVVLIET